MPQTFLAVRCVSCEKYQVKQQTKAKQWSCAICGVKQALQRVFAISNSAKDCRQRVQELSLGHGLTQEAKEAEEFARMEQLEEARMAAEEQGELWEGPDHHSSPMPPLTAHTQQCGVPQPGSRWMEYAASAEQEEQCDPEDAEDEEDPRFMTRLDAPARGRGTRSGRDSTARGSKRGRSKFAAAGEEDEEGGDGVFGSSAAAIDFGGRAKRGQGVHQGGALNVARGQLQQPLAPPFTHRAPQQQQQQQHSMQRPSCSLQQSIWQPPLQQHAFSLHFYGGQLAPPPPAAHSVVPQHPSFLHPSTSWGAHHQQQQPTLQHVNTQACADATNRSTLGKPYSAPQAGVAVQGPSVPARPWEGSSALPGSGWVVGVQGVGSKAQQQEQQQQWQQDPKAAGQIGLGALPAPSCSSHSSATAVPLPALSAGSAAAALRRGPLPAPAAVTTAAAAAGRVGGKAEERAGPQKVVGSRWDNYLNEEDVAGDSGGNDEQDGGDDGFVTAL